MVEIWLLRAVPGRRSASKQHTNGIAFAIPWYTYRYRYRYRTGMYIRYTATASVTQTSSSSGRRSARRPPSPSPLHAQPMLGASIVDLLFLSHTFLEVVLGAMKLRGRYQHEPPGSRVPRSQMYTRHHGFSILALALLSGLACFRGTDSTFGRDVSAVLVVFHGGSVVSFSIAWMDGAIPLSRVVVPHAPYAIAFLAHKLS